MSAPLAIGIVCYARLGGSGIVATDLAAGLAARGHDVHVIASAPPSRPLPASARLTFHEFDVASHPVAEQPFYSVALAETIVRVAREHALHLLNVHYAVPHAASASLARQALDDAAPRVVTTLHGSDVMPVDGSHGYAAVTRATVAASDGLTAPSEFLRREAYRRYALGEVPPIEVIPNFVDTERFAPPERRDRSRLAALFTGDGAPDADGPVLFHVSNFRAVKRVRDLVEVLAAVRRTVPARLVLVGDGPERGAAEGRARELGLAAHVRFLGSRPDFADFLPHADAFLLPSAMESFGVAALEAMSAGVPVIAYRVGGLPEVVGEEGGVLVEPYDLDAFGRAVIDVVSTPGRRDVLGGAARARVVARFRREPAIDHYEDYFRRVLERPRHATP